MKYPFYLFLLGSCFLSFSTQAQTFEEVSPSKTETTTVKTVTIKQTDSSASDDKATDSSVLQSISEAFVSDDNQQTPSNDPFAIMFRSESDGDKSSDQTTTSSDSKKDSSSTVEEDDNFFLPPDKIEARLNTPTVDGSTRGGQAFVMVDDKGNMKKVTNIFLFYDDFKISHGFANYVTCDVRFNIISNLDRKLSQLDVKLVWPDLTTTLSFENVDPYNQLYYNYTLLGNGCYSMDKAPRIVVNRCRAKGLTTSECAGKIKWVSKQ